MFPDIITKLPQADIPIETLKAFLVQGNDQQVLFMEFDSDTEVAERQKGVKSLSLTVIYSVKDKDLTPYSTFFVTDKKLGKKPCKTLDN